jgi:hypothetical protein
MIKMIIIKFKINFNIIYFGNINKMSLPTEIWYQIFKFIGRGSDYKNICLINKDWEDIINLSHPDANIKFCNQIKTLVKSIFPKNAEWQKNLTWLQKLFKCNRHLDEYVELNDSTEDNYRSLYICTELAKLKARTSYVQNDEINYEDITWEFIINNKDKNFDWYKISKHKNITWEIIKDNPNYPWNKTGVNENPNINWIIIRDNPGWDWAILLAREHW